MQKKRLIFLEVVGILTLLIFILGASFAYYKVSITGKNSASLKSTSASEGGVIIYESKTNELFLYLTELEMSKDNKGIKYYATNSSNEKYALEEEEHVFPLASAYIDGGDKTYKCYYSFKVSVGSENQMNVKVKDEMVLEFSGDSTITENSKIDFYDLQNSKDGIYLKGYFYPLSPATYDENGNLEGVHILNVELFLKNTEWEQNSYLANKNMFIKIDPVAVDGTDSMFKCVEA